MTTRRVHFRDIRSRRQTAPPPSCRSTPTATTPRHDDRSSKGARPSRTRARTLLAIVGATRISQADGTNASTPSSDPATEREAFLNDPERLAGIERLHQQMDEGWIPFDSEPAVPGVIVPDNLWVKWLDDNPVIKVEIDETVERQPVYQGEDGDLVGYYYSNRGYVPVELADTFDPGESG